MTQTPDHGRAEFAAEIRPAMRQDAKAIAESFLIASDGVAAYIWEKNCPEGMPLLDVGTSRYSRENTQFSYQNCDLLVVDGKPIGMLHCFEMHADDSEEEDPVLRPYSLLEDPGSLYVAGLAIDVDCRGKGLGRRMMQRAEEKADAMGLQRVSLICFDRNRIAMSLYQDLGYVETDRAAVVPTPHLKYPDGDAVLMIKTLG